MGVMSLPSRGRGSGAAGPSERAYLRTGALLLMAGTPLKSVLCDLSAGRVAHSIPHFAVQEGPLLQNAVGTSGTLLTRLYQTHPSLAVTIARPSRMAGSWRRRHPSSVSAADRDVNGTKPRYFRGRTNTLTIVHMF